MENDKPKSSTPSGSVPGASQIPGSRRNLKISAHGDGPVTVVLVNINGYGQYYVKTLFDAFPPSGVVPVAAVDPDPDPSPVLQRIKARNLPVFDSLDRFYTEEGKADLVVVASPIHCHVPQSCIAVEHGSCVLCEKPVAATVQEVDNLITVKERAHRSVHIGYQWSYSDAIRALKADILSGLFGKPIRLRMLYLWPRDRAYYHRNDYAGKQKTADGQWVLDSVAHGAMAHDIHNMFYLLGDTIETSAVPATLSAELYRAYPIENFDTAACRVMTTEGVELLFFISHAVPEKYGPFFVFEFEEAVVAYGNEDEIVATDRNGEEKRYGSPFATDPFRKLFYAVEEADSRTSVPDGSRSVICGPEAARAQVVCVNGMQDSMPDIIALPDRRLRPQISSEGLWVEGLAETWTTCYERGRLPHEMNIAWSEGGKTVDLTDYRWFPGGKP